MNCRTYFHIARVILGKQWSWLGFSQPPHSQEEPDLKVVAGKLIHQLMQRREDYRR
jgi:hypothetical protein